MYILENIKNMVKQIYQKIVKQIYQQYINNNILENGKKTVFHVISGKKNKKNS